MRRARILSIFLAITAILSPLVAAPASAIVGGTDVTVARTWIAALLDNTGRQFCAGSLYKRQWVITSASCLAPPQNLQGMSLRIGSLNRTSGGTVIPASLVISHPGFGQNGSAFDDIALIKLASQAPVLNLPVPLATSTGSYWDGKFLRLLGWGALCAGLGCPSSDRLQRVDLEVVPTADCRFTSFQYPTELCLASSTTATACRGDGGGPAVNQTLGTLVGVASRQPVGDDLDCGQDYDGIYTRVHPYKSWFDVTIANNP